MSQPILHHRMPEFEALMADVRKGLKALFQTEQDVLMLACTGTGVMEAALVNTLSPGDRVLVVDAGKFGSRWQKLCLAYGIDPVVLHCERGQALDHQRLEETLKLHQGSVRAVLFQASETSTGARMPVREICEISRRAGALSVCDAITALGVFDLPMDRWGIDVLMTASQKALMLPPGLSFIALSEKAWQAQSRATTPRFYLDLAREQKAQSKNQSAWTPATTLIMGLQESLRIIFREGLERRFQRHERLAQATRQAVTALGLQILAETSPSAAVTAVRVPSSIADGKKIPRLMRDRHQVIITGGQDELEGKIFRLSHFGHCSAADVLTGVAALEKTLQELGHPMAPGSGIHAAQVALSEARDG
jgi:aspartate aminotransferase-like enzyme